MIRISQLKLKAGHSDRDLKRKIIQRLRISDTELVNFVIRKKSADARNKEEILFVYTVDVTVKDQESVLRKNKNPQITQVHDVPYRYPEYGDEVLACRPLIIGSGPAGLFAAYFLAEKGFRPLILERGADVRTRLKDVERFWETGILDPESNIQFGEGGAGTFSDGKLNTGNNDLYGRNRLVLETFVKNGAPQEILYINKPHLGSDLLLDIISGMRRKIESYGGEYCFHTCFTDFIMEGNQVKGVRTADGREFLSDVVVLATGHSAGDTYEYIIRKTPLRVSSKPFAVGVRVEHLQSEIDRAQYGEKFKGLLPPADYKLTYKTSSGTSVYSFCMCPGGYVVNASSEQDSMCVNGMSYSDRGGRNANSAIVAAVHPSDDPMENMMFVRDLERKAYREGSGAIVSQLFGDFEENRISESFGSVVPAHKGTTVMGNIRNILPENICSDISEAMHAFSKKITGFDAPDVILSAVESRTSSPVRIVRGENMQSNVTGIYPAGEGAGYAGGIMSAAIDGVKVFEKICESYRPGNSL